MSLGQPIAGREPACACGLGRAGATAIAHELVDLTTRLSDLAFDLGSDQATLRRHMSSLQAIDLITQIQLALADLLRSEAPLSARIDDITVEALSASLRTRISAEPADATG